MEITIEPFLVRPYIQTPVPFRDKNPTVRKNPLPSGVKCYKCNLYKGKHRHHILYLPELFAVLCRGCHKEVTYLNGLMAKYWRRVLTNEDRLRVYEQFLNEVRGKWIKKAVRNWRRLDSATF